MVVVGDMPYDTGYMFLNGASFYETNAFILVKYDIERVPYIIYNEEGTIFTTKNQYFIRDKTIGDLQRHAAYQQAGLHAPMDTLNETVKRRGSLNMIKQGAIDKIRGEYSASDF